MVERTLGKGEVGSSNLLLGSSFEAGARRKAHEFVLITFNLKIYLEIKFDVQGKIRTYKATC